MSGALVEKDKAWWKNAGTCSRCGVVVAAYQIARRRGYVAVCAGCLRGAEKRRLRRMPGGWEGNYSRGGAEARREGDGKNGKDGKDGR